MFLLGRRERGSWLLRFGCVLAGEERAGCLGLVVFLLGKRELVVKGWLYSCWGRESWLLRFGCVLTGKEKACCLGLVVFLLGKRELVA